MYSIFTSRKSSEYSENYKEEWNELESSLRLKDLKKELTDEYHTAFDGMLDGALTFLAPIYAPFAHFGMFMFNAFIALYELVVSAVALIIAIGYSLSGNEDAAEDRFAHMKLSVILAFTNAIDSAVNLLSTFTSPFSEIVKFVTRSVASAKEKANSILIDNADLDDVIDLTNGSIALN